MTCYTNFKNWLLGEFIMKKLIVIVSDGFEEIEAVSIIDICRRATLDVTIAAVENIVTKGAHDIKITADIMIKDAHYEDYDMVILPGGLPNAYTLAEDTYVQNFLKDMKRSKRHIGAICAAPYALHTAGVLNQNFTCYPSFEEKIRVEGYCDNQEFIIDDDVITSRGPGTAMEFALQIVKLMCNEDRYAQIKSALLAK